MKTPYPIWFTDWPADMEVSARLHGGDFLTYFKLTSLALMTFGDIF